MYMARIYIVRHCEAEGNSKRLFQGSTDCDVTKLGEKQLELLSERFENIHLDAIYTSPLIRARKTAEAVRGGRNIEIIALAGLAEIHGGVLEGKPFMESFRNDPALAQVWNEHPQDFAPEGGEPMRDAYERIWNTVSAIASDNTDKTVALATHGGVIRCLACRLLYGTIDRLKDTAWCENTAVSLAIIDRNGAALEYMNDYSHLPGEYLPLHSRFAEVIKE